MMANWPDDLLAVVSEVQQKLGVDSLYYEEEISGLGGARTFRARTDMQEGIGQRVVLKIGAHAQISDEQRRYHQAKIHFGTQPALQDFAEQGNSLSWLAMSVALDGLGDTLRRRFDNLSEKEIETVIDALFKKGIRLYDKTVFNKARSAFNQYSLHPSLVPKLREIDDGPYTLFDWWEHAAVSDEQRSTEAYIHGDLHCGNVLVDGNGDSIKISLIDFGLSGMGHAYRDLAKLERDLCLFVASARDHSVSARLKAIDSQLQGTQPASGSKDADVERAVRAIRQIRELAQGFSQVSGGNRWKHEYDVALIAQFMFAAGNRNISEAKRRAALEHAYALRKGLIELSPKLEPKADVVRERELEDQAWKVAYSLLRLDQLPRGGWSRSLPQWMDFLWEGEHGTVFRSPAMKDDGGIDSAGYAVQLLSRFASWVNCAELVSPAGTRDALKACAIGLQNRVGPHGGLDEGTTSRGYPPPPKKIRHTLVALLVHLNCKRLGIPGFEGVVADLMVDYLLKAVPEWGGDKGHLFGMYASAVALQRVLGEPPASSFLDNWSTLRTCLDQNLPAMAKRLEDVMYKPEPEGTYPSRGLVQDLIEASFFTPYYRWWRMERSNALMFLPFLFDDSASRFTRENDLPAATPRIGAGLTRLLNEVQSTGDLSEGLIRYHESVGGTQAPRDWGLSAEFLRLIEMPVIQALLRDAGVAKNELEQKMSVLRRSLRETLADYGTYHGVFRCTHGLSAGAYLSESVTRRISPRQVMVLDEQIRVACVESCSEQALHRLAQFILADGPVANHQVHEEDSPPESKMLTELFVRNLAAGGHIRKDWWTDSSYERTIDYFNRPAAKPNPAVQSGIHDTLFLRLLDVSGQFGGKGLRAVDLGCGHGMAAKWLIERSFDVTLVDGSTEMIRRAKATLKGVGTGTANFLCRDVRKIDEYLTVGSWDLVIANALFVHIAPMHAAELIAKVFNLLKSGGHFFFNLKIRDHTLVALDGRYFAYYPDFDVPRSMLRVAGFEVDEIALRDNHQTCYGVPKDIHWANFYCRKPR